MEKECTPINLTVDPIDFTEETPSPLDNLPTELWLHVFSYLGHRDLAELRSTCKLFNDLVNFPLMQKSKITFDYRKFSKIFVNDQNYPVHTIEICECDDSPAAFKILDKFVTKHLKSLIIHESCTIFQWLAEKPLPNLRTIELRVCYSKQIELGNWHFGMYQKLEEVHLYIRSPNESDPLNLFEGLLETKLNLKTLYVNVTQNLLFLLKEIRNVYDHSGVKLLCGCSGRYDDDIDSDDDDCEEIIFDDLDDYHYNEYSDSDDYGEVYMSD